MVSERRAIWQAANTISSKTALPGCQEKVLNSSAVVTFRDHTGEKLLIFKVSVYIAHHTYAHVCAAEKAM